MHSRRTVLGTVAMIAISGCTNPRGRSLTLGEGGATWDPETGVVDGSVEATARNAPDDWATFNDIAVVGYDGSSRRRCRTAIGTVKPDESTTFHLSCPARPSYLTFTAREDRCDGNTSIGVYELVEEADEAYYTRATTKECGDNVFPIPEQDT